jgi:hypothetical protein
VLSKASIAPLIASATEPPSPTAVCKSVIAVFKLAGNWSTVGFSNLAQSYTSAALAAECERYLLDEHIEIKKRSKSGDVVSVDIRPLVKSVKASFEGEALKLSCVLSGDQSCFLNPEHVISALKEKFSILSSPDLTSEYYSIMREKAYLADMSEFR